MLGSPRSDNAGQRRASQTKAKARMKLSVRHLTRLRVHRAGAARRLFVGLITNRCFRTVCAKRSEMVSSRRRNARSPADDETLARKKAQRFGLWRRQRTRTAKAALVQNAVRLFIIVSATPSPRCREFSIIVC